MCKLTKVRFLSHLSLSLSLSLSAEVEELGSKELELGDKTITIEIKANEQGKFVKILEVHSTMYAPPY